MFAFFIQRLPDIFPNIAHGNTVLQADACFIQFLRHPCAVGIDHLPDQSLGGGFSPEEFTLGVCEAGTHGTFRCCDIAQPAEVLAGALTKSGNGYVVRFFRLDLYPAITLTKDQSLIFEVPGALELSEDVGCGGVG